MAFEFFFWNFKKCIHNNVTKVCEKKCIALNEDDIKLRDEETKIKKKKECGKNI